MVTDKCPECQTDQIDLNALAFQKVTLLSNGLPSVSLLLALIGSAAQVSAPIISSMHEQRKCPERQRDQIDLNALAFQKGPQSHHHLPSCLLCFGIAAHSHLPLY